MSCIYKRMTDRRLCIWSVPIFFLTKSDKHTVINNASPRRSRVLYWNVVDGDIQMKELTSSTQDYKLCSKRVPPEKGAVLLFCCSHQVWYVQEIIPKILTE